MMLSASRLAGLVVDITRITRVVVHYQRAFHGASSRIPLGLPDAIAQRFMLEP